VRRARVPADFLFVDESGDPGVGGNPFYLLVCVQVDEDRLELVRKHLTAFRYHHEVTREFKAQRWADKLSQQTRRLLEYLADRTDDGTVTSSATWLNKPTYQQNRGPYLGDSWKFRHYQLRRLLEVHVQRKGWNRAADLVIDRWRMPLDQRRNLEEYLRGNYNLRPTFASITTVSSVYADPIQVVDIYCRLLRRVVTGVGNAEETALAARLIHAVEIKGGLF
jgi:hypothetical protein